MADTKPESLPPTASWSGRRYWSEIRSIMLRGSRDVTQRFIPVFSVFAAIFYILFFFICSAMGMQERVVLRVGMALVAFLFFFFPRTRPLTTSEFAMWELSCAFTLPFQFVYLATINGYNHFWFFGVIVSGLVYGFMCSIFTHTFSMYPVFLFIGAALAIHLTNDSWALLVQGLPLYAVATLAAVCAGLFKVTIELIYRTHYSLQAESMDRRHQEQMRRNAEEKLAMEQELRQAHKLEAIGRLAGGVAHDFNNQLSAIVSSAEMLRRSVHDDDSQEFIDLILKASRRSADLTRQLLSFARRSPGALETVDCHSLILETISLIRRSVDKRITVKEDLAARQHSVRGDASLLQNAFLNLCMNACQAMPTGGILALRTRNIIQESSGTVLEIRVEDTGVGMSDDVKKHIFEPFFTTKELGHGTGLGLSAVYGTIRSHAGSILFESQEGKGTTFICSLPVTPEEPVVQDSEVIVRGSGTILVVDDEPLVRMVARKLLASLGYTVVTAQNGREAVAAYERAWHDIDMVLLDVIMPELDGPDTFKKLKAMNPGVRVLIASGYSLADSVKTMIEGGALGFIQKPYTMMELSRKVAKALQH